MKQRTFRRHNRTVVSIAQTVSRVDPTALRDVGLQLVVRPDLGGHAPLAQRILGLDVAWAIIAGSEPYSRRFLQSLPGLKVIARAGVGVDGVDVEAATNLGIAVVTTPGANDDAVADFTIGLTLAAMRNLVSLDASLRSGSWRPGSLGLDLFRSSVGIVGFGSVGKAVARRLSGFECRLLAVDPRPDRAVASRLGVQLVSLDKLLPQVDVLTIHIPLLPSTRALIGQRELAQLRDGAVVVNTSRGGVMDEVALAHELATGRLYGAGIDVFSEEPISTGNVLLECPTATLTPHYAAFTFGAAARMESITLHSLRSLSVGTLPSTCVNADGLRARGYWG